MVTNISEECAAYIFRLHEFILKTEAALSLATLVPVCWTAWCHIPEHGILLSHRCEKLKCCLLQFVCTEFF